MILSKKSTGLITAPRVESRGTLRADMGLPLPPPWLTFSVLSSLRLLEDLACSHRLRGLPSSSGSRSLLHLRALAPQRRVVSFWQGTVEPQPPPHARSVVAWHVARQGCYGGHRTSH